METQTKQTKVQAEAGQQDLRITREFDLPVDLLFKAYTEAEFLTQWMGTRVLALESRKHGHYLFETRTNKGTVAFLARGVIHELIPDEKICRTFEMEGKGFGVQLEMYEFKKLPEDRCKLNIHVVYESVTQRDEVLKLPFTQGINWAHNRLQEVMLQFKNNFS